jgi:hypothetical protein
MAQGPINPTKSYPSECVGEMVSHRSGRLVSSTIAPFSTHG